MEELYRAAKTVVSFLLVETIMIQLLPAGEFRKMVKRFCGIVLIILLLKPLLSLAGMDPDSQIRWIKNTQIEQEIKNCENLIKSGDAYLSEKSQEQYRKLVRTQLEEEAEQEGLELKECEVEINDAGELTGIRIHVSDREKNSGKIKVQAQVKKIDMGKSEEDAEEAQEPQIINMKNRIISTYGLNEEQVTVNKD